MQRLLSKSQIDKLGERLAQASTPAQEDLELLQEVRAIYDPVLAQVEGILQDLGLEPGSRLKTLTTIVDKLQREHTRLSSMQDIAGLRVVEKLTLKGQDALTNRIVSALPGTARVVDRRQSPSHGYRAVHVIAQVDGLPVEIQIRTPLQHLWAQIIEKIADSWGRGIRYGQVPEDPKQRALLEKMMEISSDLASFEESRSEVEGLMKEFQELETIDEARWKAYGLEPDETKQLLREASEKLEARDREGKEIQEQTMGLLKSIVGSL